MQRRTLAACVFAFAFILFYEARGERLVTFENTSQQDSGAAVEQHFWEQCTAGTFVLLLGALLIATLRRPSRPVVIPPIEIAIYAVAIGILLGTAVVSWTVVNRGNQETRVLSS